MKMLTGNQQLLPPTFPGIGVTNSFPALLPAQLSLECPCTLSLVCTMAGCISRACESGTKQIFVDRRPQGKMLLDQALFPQADNMRTRLWLRTPQALRPPACGNGTGCSSAVTGCQAGDDRVPSNPEGHVGWEGGGGGL